MALPAAPRQACGGARPLQSRTAWAVQRACRPRGRPRGSRTSPPPVQASSPPAGCAAPGYLAAAAPHLRMAEIR